MPARPAVPAPRPLSPRAAQFVREIFQQENERQQSVAKAFDAGVASVTRPVAKSSKADKSPMVACYDASGNLVGMADPDDITILADAKAPGSADAPPTDMQPAPSASVGTPADAVQQAVTKALARSNALGTELRKKIGPNGTAVSAGERQQAADDMMGLAVDAYKLIRAGRPQRMF